MTTDLRPGLAALAGVTAMLMLSVAIRRSGNPEPPTLAQALRASHAATAGEARATDPSAARDYDAFLVMQRADCEGNVHVLRFFARAPIRSRVRMAALLLVGSDADVDAVRQRLGHAPEGVPIHRADAATVRALRAVGYRSTPFLVIAEHGGDVKMTLQLPSTPEEQAAFARWLPHLSPVRQASRWSS